MMTLTKQITDTILMVRPANFGYNKETAVSNAFQTREGSQEVEAIAEKAIGEFDEMVRRLRAKGINIIVAQDSQQPAKTDAVFPNNWVTFHHNGTMIIYPLQPESRRLEREEAVLALVEKDFEVKRRVDFTSYEDKNLFLEGTGSLILDRDNRLAYACLSPRTSPHLLDEFCKWAEYQKIVFNAVDESGQDIYHTNVMMALGKTFVVICMDSVRDAKERGMLEKYFQATDKEIIEISYAQLNAFAGNMLQVRSTDGTPYLVMSQQAYESLDHWQVEKIKKHTDIIYSPIDTIEKYGGGSARCMMAEVFLPAKKR